MSEIWDDFAKNPNIPDKTKREKQINDDNDNEDNNKLKDGKECDWGFDRFGGQNNHEDDDGLTPSLSKFITVYEQYIENRETFSKDQTTTNHDRYSNNPQKTLRDWFENEGSEFAIKTDQQKPSEVICSLDIPIEKHDFTITSQIHKKKQAAVEEICIIACKLLDQSLLLYSDTYEQKQADHAWLAAEKKRQFSEANKEDDIEFDISSKRHCDRPNQGDSINIGANTTKVNTYDSLMADWKELNMSILMLKAKLVKLDLSVSKNKGEKSKSDLSDDEVDPLDEFMSTLDNKTQLTMDEKIEKTRIKSEIASLERKQTEVARLIEIAKPKFDIKKVTNNKLNK